TASILEEEQDIAPDWRARFQRNLREDSERLAESTGALVRYLDDQASAGVKQRTPAEEFDEFLAASAYHFPELEGKAAADPEEVLAGTEAVLSEAARGVARSHLSRYRQDAAAMPLAEFSSTAHAVQFDPAALMQTFGVDLASVFRRLSSLPPHETGTHFGLVTCDASGTLLYRKPIDGFAVPRYGGACPLWPLYQALLRPMAPIRRVVEVVGRSPVRFMTYAVSQPRQPSRIGGPEVVEATMLIVSLQLLEQFGGDTGLPVDLDVGMACRVCPRRGCAARNEPSILVDAV
ncbi:MAG: short-chain fatty acyl-CoA regulator family protein, partial [Pseudomonadota bacterium]